LTIDMPPTYRIHPAIGIARLGDSPAEFLISPETPAARPIACDSEGNPALSPDGLHEIPAATFKDAEGRIKRQAARFQIYVYDDEHPDGIPLRIGDRVEGGGNAGTLVDIQWRVYVANKKAAWYEFHGLKGEHGYGDSHPLRNAAVTDANARQQLIIDPGPRVVNLTDRRRASFGRDGGSVYAPVFPPPELAPNPIDTLGEILTDAQGRLLVLGGQGCSGTSNTGPGHPRIDDYANNDGWYDDTSDGPVMARLVMFSGDVGRQRFVDVEYPAWVLTGYPRYVPEILDMVTVEDVVYDLAVRRFAYRTDLYGIPNTWDEHPRVDPDDSGALQLWNAAALDWNPDYRPWFYRDVWSILFRADEFSYLNNVLQQSNFPHNQTQRGNFDVTRLSVPPFLSARALTTLQQEAVDRNQSGALFLDAIRVRLQMFDDAIEQAMQRRIRAATAEGEPVGSDPALEKSIFTLIRMVRSVLRDAAPGEPEPPADTYDALQAAAATFAAAILPPDPGRTPQATLELWKAAEDHDPSGYSRAREAFARDVSAVLESFIRATIARWEGAALKVGTRATLLRAAAESSTATGELDAIVRGAVGAIATDTEGGFRSGHLLDAQFRHAVAQATNDPYKPEREYLYDLLRRPGEENVFRTAGKPESRRFRLPLMPLLAGDNPTSNELPSKFLRLTDFQLFILRQWADGKFYNEIDEGWVPDAALDPFQPYRSWQNRTPRDLDRGVLSNLLGGAFYPGGEVCWIIRNPSAYRQPYRLIADPDFYAFGQTAANANASSVSEQLYLAATGVALSQRSNLARGLQPGDLTKYSALPWQADFNECTTQNIDITHELWNTVRPGSERDPWLERELKTWDTLWWPAHRPLQTYEVVSLDGGQPTYRFLYWARGVPQTLAGDLKMVTEWSRLGFVVRNPYLPPDKIDAPSPDKKYISVERTPEDR
jgi:hypothetical protein